MPALAHFRRDALGERVQQVLSSGCGDRCDDRILGRAWLPISHIMPEAPIEEVDILAHEGNGGPHILDPEVFQVMPVEKDASGIRIIEAHEQT